MKRVIYLSTFASLILLLGCNSSNITKMQSIPIVSTSTESKPSESINTEKKSENTEDEWNVYSNARYGYSIRYPSEWTSGEEADNGDGKRLYIGNPDVDITVYASNYMEGISDPYHNDEGNVQAQLTKLDNGYESVLIVGKQDGKILYDMVYISTEDVEYHFHAIISENFFEGNEQILLKVAKSLNTPEWWKIDFIEHFIIYLIWFDTYPNNYETWFK